VKQVNTNLKLDKAAQTAAKHVKQVNTNLSLDKAPVKNAKKVNTNLNKDNRAVTLCAARVVLASMLVWWGLQLKTESVHHATPANIWVVTTTF
jgi:hypothetical protein